MTDAQSPVTTSAADTRLANSTSPAPPHRHHQQDRSTALPANGAIEDDDGEIACICAYLDDDGNTIQCDRCLRWQHIICYYPPPTEMPGDNEKHFCIDCSHRELDARKATERQRRAIEERNGLNGIKRPAAKSHKKKPKEPVNTAQVNGWASDGRHTHIHNHDRKSASPRDQPPPAKRTKMNHRTSSSISQVPTGRRRNGTTSVHPPRSSSESPDQPAAQNSIIPHYSPEFLNLYRPQSPQNETDTNLMNSITVTNSLSEWLTDSEAVSNVTNGMTQGEIFKRWDGTIEDIPGRPDVDVQWMEDHRFAVDGQVPRWARLAVDQVISQGTFIGELKGHIGHVDEYKHDPDNRWDTLRHPEPFVFFHPHLPIYIDARQEGSVFRFVRRSCRPNAELQTIITEGTEYHFCFMATREIAIDEQITIAWQIPDIVSERVYTNLYHSASFEPHVRQYLLSWVTKILANCGPCACNASAREPCLMAPFDRRGLPELTEPPMLKSQKGRKRRLHHIASIDTARTSPSRSGSEARKVEHDEDGTDSRSVSGSRGSVSRDITPSNTNGGTNGNQTTSERELKKIALLEQQFQRQQEEEKKKQKKKRGSGGSNLMTPASATSGRSFAEAHALRPSPQDRRQKPLGKDTNGQQPQYVDTGTPSQRLSNPVIRSKRPAKTETHADASRKGSATSKSAKPSYSDVAVQCDLDVEEEASRKITQPRPRRQVVSLAQRLLQRCLANQANRQAAVAKAEPTSMPKADAMDLDTTTPAVVETKPQPWLTSPKPSVENVSDELSLKQRVETDDEQDTSMQEVGDETLPTVPVISHKSSSPPPDESGGPVNHEATVGSHTSVDPPAPPWLSGSQVSIPEATEATTRSPSVDKSPNPHRPTDMHVDMPPPSANIALGIQPSSATHTMTTVQSPLALTPGSQIALFSPSVTQAVTPSPARKKMSLSDYTKRSKARESEGGGSSAMDVKGGESSPSSVSGQAASIGTSGANQVADVLDKARDIAVEEAAIEDDKD